MDSPVRSFSLLFPSRAPQPALSPHIPMIDHLEPELLDYATRSIDRMAALCYAASFHAGWHHDPATSGDVAQNHGERFMLMVTELGEAMEASRKDLPSDKLDGFHGVEEEIADALIRIFDYCGRNNLRIGRAVTAKLLYNAVREDHKREARLAPGGKKV